MKTPPITAYQETLGLLYFARMLDKMRRHARGELREDFHEFIGKGMDGLCCDFLRVNHENLRVQVLAGGTDEELLRGCFAAGREPSEGDLVLWNHFIKKLGWRDGATEMLARRKKESGLAHRDDIVTMIEYFEVDEGRKP